MSKNILGEILKDGGITDEIKHISECGGGDISSAYQVQTAKETYFIKTNSPSFIDNFRAECAGLEHIKNTNTVLCPTPIKAGVLNKLSYLIMTCIPNLRSGTADLGEPLARMHKAGQAQQFGFPITTFCGSTVLDNTMTDEPWSEWFARHRISFVLNQIGPKRITKRPVKEVEDKIIEILRPHDNEVKPTLVHGDLWSGNCGTSQGTPCIYDPACYYGDGEVDLAMSELFGSFGRKFFENYEKVLKIHDGYQTRKRIYNLYHILNHAYMFGGGYETEASSIIESLFR
ncbi:fructosamine-3-kinase [Tritrichomonas foetus]|uniref:protein-ribulosamine 3-kinase n=1 Tax=Tritrichomonas foetus TaxID=1144522 RepID=A0A1J4L4M9_9EUKA|nr:fructosamine-3-kinase [Tritrichomonas foetus]|eukprot:OHT16886.1 fructosamine-3-kinase [Tritrichomonas foetus]